MSNDLSLGQLLTRGIRAAFKVSEAGSPNDAPIQTLLQAALSDLTICSSLISRLGILSPNETLEDINTRDLRCLLVECLRGEMEVLVKTKGGKERVQWLTRAKEHFEAYITLIDRYEVIPEQRRGVFAGPQHATQDPSRRRESKIAQYKMEREIKGKLEARPELRKRRSERRPHASSSAAVAEAEDDDLAYSSNSEEDDTSRPLFINLLLLHYLTAHAELSSIAQELELLQIGMAMSDLPRGPGKEDGREHLREEEDELSWRVERLGQGASGPLLDPHGKVLRPFTILPSTTSHLSTRLRLQEEVFRPSHRLPTMTIDEFLEQEEAQGNILQGGGPASSEAVEQARRDEKGAKEEDTVGGYAAEEEGIRKVREWDEFRDTHRKGEGNMHNRG